MAFIVGQQYSRQYIAEHLGGNIQQFLPTHDRTVVCCCFSPARNVQAPHKFLVGGTNRYRAARWFAEQGNLVPFFKEVEDGWEHIGDYRVRGWSENPDILTKEKKRGHDDDVRIVLYLESAAEANQRIQAANNTESRKGGAPRQPDPKRRKLVEDNAIDLVWDRFEELGYKIKNRQDDNCGWDLEAIRGAERLKLEVKGLSGMDLNADLTVNEFEKMGATEHLPDYRVCVLLDALRPAETNLYIIAHEPISEKWQDQHGRKVNVQPRTAARLTWSLDR